MGRPGEELHYLEQCSLWSAGLSGYAACSPQVVQAGGPLIGPLSLLARPLATRMIRPACIRRKLLQLQRSGLCLSSPG